MSGFTRRHVLAIGTALTIATAAPVAAQDIRAEADAVLAASWPADGPGGAVIVTRGGKVVYEGGRGLADVQRRTPILPTSVFRIGSITKQFSAAVVLQLVEEGRLSLDDRVSKFVPGYPAPGGDATVRQLLNHTVGIQSYTSIPGWMVEANTARAATTAEMIAQFRDLPSPFLPGQDWSYNNSGYILVGAVIEAVTGKPWHVAVQQRIARPLRLATLRYGVDEASIAGMTTPYTLGLAGAIPAQKIHMSVPGAAGALTGSVRDLATWAAALHHGKVVRPASYALMIAPTTLPGGRTVPYGFGLETQTVRGSRAIGHNGGIPGGSSDSLYFPDKDVFVAVLANTDSPSTPTGIVLRQIAALAIGNPFPRFDAVTVNPATLAPLFGVYAIAEPKGERRFFARDGLLYAQRMGAPATRVYAAGGDRFFYGPRSLSWFAIRRDPSGRHAMEMHPNGADEVERATWSGPILP